MSRPLPLPELDALDASVRAQLARRPPIDLYRMVAHAPGLLAPFMALGAANFGATQIPPPLREALILRVAMHHRSAYEIHHHRRIAREAGLSEAAIDALLAGNRESQAWDAGIADAVALVDALVVAQDIAPALVARVVQAHGHRGYVEMALIAGFYRMVATFLQATGLEPEAEDRINGWVAPQAR